MQAISGCVGLQKLNNNHNVKYSYKNAELGPFVLLRFLFVISLSLTFNKKTCMVFSKNCKFELYFTMIIIFRLRVNILRKKFKNITA